MLKCVVSVRNAEWLRKSIKGVSRTSRRNLSVCLKRKRRIIRIAWNSECVRYSSVTRLT